MPFDMPALLSLKEIGTPSADELFTYFQAQIADWAFHNLHHAFYNPGKKKDSSTFDVLIRFSSCHQENVPGVEKFLCKYLSSWNGDLHSSAVFALVSRFSMSSAAKCFECVLDPVHKIFMFGSLQKQCEILECLTELCKHWITLTVAKLDGGSARASITGGFDDEVDPETAVQALLSYIDSCVSLVPTFHGIPTPDILLVVLNFYMMLLDTYEETKYFVCEIPQRGVVEACFYSSSLVCLDRLCNFLLRCRQAVLEVKELAETEFVGDFNHCITWVASCLGDHDWEDSGDIPNFTHPVHPQSLAVIGPRNEASSLWRHPALHLPLQRFCSESEVTPDMLKRDQDLLHKYLEYLSDLCPSLVQLARNSVLH